MILSAFADEYDAGLDAQLEGLNRLGISFLEIRGVDGKNIGDLSEEEAREVRKKLDAAGIRVSAVGSPLGKIPLDGDLVSHREKARRVFQTAKILDTEFVRIFSYYPGKITSEEEFREKAFREVERLLDLGDAFGLRLGHENEARIYGDSPRRCRELMDAFRGRLGCTFDMGNFVLGGADPLDAYLLLKPDILWFHVKDAVPSGAILPPGMGKAKIREILRDFEKTGGKPYFAALEPHLSDFVGLSGMAAEKFDTPVSYGSPREAFADAAKRFRELMQ